MSGEKPIPKHSDIHNEEYSRHNLNICRFIYVKTDSGSHSTHGHSALKCHIENYLFDNGFQYRKLNREMLKVDLEKNSTREPWP
ncbi:hypothetical protein ElyMa_005561000 [Elysia marginata]|uniref:Uncharacterized protein n=1 Tax=Elysia marginata TaxID=1093978 RepID=A0AAV4F137_9GAST|nr:hypothetical protein ElyMa_005561000 [Elysia marginata]